MRNGESRGKNGKPFAKQETRTYPHAVFFYDFESYHDKTQRNEAMRDLIYENAHMPISVSLGDTLDRQPTHICDPNTQELIRRFMEELEQHGTCVPR